ncbi:uncharacterized protein LOC129053094 isoform X3 [Pongo abelii]|uniref:uncharacterized protein LOC129053094 isoform X3 n=1 Tax=Pongo abelii TaxID=9601 RepID=UPI0023E89EA5|nr:uncharacterized protein LOC129053094 isoform X3 [Pongo abelii]
MRQNGSSSCIPAATSEFRPRGLEPALFHEPPDQPGGLCLSSLSEMCLLLPGEAGGSRNAGDEGCFGLSIHLSTPNWTPPATAGAC